jgi:hypothetical protein
MRLTETGSGADVGGGALANTDVSILVANSPSPTLKKLPVNCAQVALGHCPRNDKSDGKTGWVKVSGKNPPRKPWKEVIGALLPEMGRNGEKANAHPNSLGRGQKAGMLGQRPGSPTKPGVICIAEFARSISALKSLPSRVKLPPVGRKSPNPSKDGVAGSHVNVPLNVFAVGPPTSEKSTSPKKFIVTVAAPAGAAVSTRIPTNTAIVFVMCPPRRAPAPSVPRQQQES